MERDDFEAASEAASVSEREVWAHRDTHRNLEIRTGSLRRAFRRLLRTKKNPSLSLSHSGMWQKRYDALKAKGGRRSKPPRGWFRTQRGVYVWRLRMGETLGSRGVRIFAYLCVSSDGAWSYNATSESVTGNLTSSSRERNGTSVLGLAGPTARAARSIAPAAGSLPTARQTRDSPARSRQARAWRIFPYFVQAEHGIVPLCVCLNMYSHAPERAQKAHTLASLSGTSIPTEERARA